MEYWVNANPQGDFSIIMAIVDFLPVLFYFLAAWLVAKDLYKHVSPTTYGMLAGGAITCFVGGALKALWKLMFCLGINYPFFFTALFPMQAPGFCIYLAGLIIALRETKNKTKDSAGLNMAVATTVTTSLPLIMFQTIGSIGSLVCLCIFAKRAKQTKAIICFVGSAVFLLAMGGLGAALDTSLAWVNWVEQLSNTIGQVLFYVGALTLHKSGYLKVK